MNNQVPIIVELKTTGLYITNICFATEGDVT